MTTSHSFTDDACGAEGVGGSSRQLGLVVAGGHARARSLAYKINRPVSRLCKAATPTRWPRSCALLPRHAPADRSSSALRPWTRTQELSATSESHSSLGAAGSPTKLARPSLPVGDDAPLPTGHTVSTISRIGDRLGND